MLSNKAEMGPARLGPNATLVPTDIAPLDKARTVTSRQPSSPALAPQRRQSFTEMGVGSELNLTGNL